MADRNPNIPAERRMDMETKETFHEEEAKKRYTEKQAKLSQHADTEVHEDKLPTEKK